MLTAGLVGLYTGVCIDALIAFGTSHYDSQAGPASVDEHFEPDEQ